MNRLISILHIFLMVTFNVKAEVPILRCENVEVPCGVLRYNINQLDLSDLAANPDVMLPSAFIIENSNSSFQTDERYYPMFDRMRDSGMSDNGPSKIEKMMSQANEKNRRRIESWKNIQKANAESDNARSKTYNDLKKRMAIHDNSYNEIKDKVAATHNELDQAINDVISEFNDHEFRWDDSEFSDSLEDVSEKLLNTSPKRMREKEAKFIGLKSVINADILKSMNEHDSAKNLLKIAWEMADIASGFIPGIAEARDGYEAFTGKDLVSGKSLSYNERIIAGASIFVGVATLGAATVVKGFFRTTIKALPKVKKASNVSKFTNQAEVVYDSARKLKLTEKYQIKDLVNYLGDNFKWFVSNERGSLNLIGKYKPAPRMPIAFKNLQITRRKTPSSGGGLRKRWKDKKGNIFEWDSQHGRIEKYNKKGKHLGEFDADSGIMTKPADPTRKVEP